MWLVELSIIFQCTQNTTSGYAEMWESGNHSHPRRGLGFMDEAAEDISCNIMPEPLPAPLHPPPPRLLSPIQSTHTDMRFFSNDNFFFFFVNWTKRKPAGCVVVAKLVGAWENEGIAYRNGLHECAGTRQNIESEPLWQRRPFSCLSWCAFCCWMKGGSSMRLTGR